MKLKFQNKMGSKGCKWSSFKAPGRQALKSLCLVFHNDLSDNKTDPTDRPTARPRPLGFCCLHRPRAVPRDWRPQRSRKWRTGRALVSDTRSQSWGSRSLTELQSSDGPMLGRRSVEYRRHRRRQISPCRLSLSLYRIFSMKVAAGFGKGVIIANLFCTIFQLHTRRVEYVFLVVHWNSGTVEKCYTCILKYKL